MKLGFFFYGCGKSQNTCIKAKKYCLTIDGGRCQRVNKEMLFI